MLSYIETSFIEDPTLCDDLIDYHKKSKNKRHGITGTGYGGSKKSIDVGVSRFEIGTDGVVKRYFNHLQDSIDNYHKKYPNTGLVREWGLLEDFNIQKYKPGEGFTNLHCERGSGAFPCSNRFLVFMTYLNDVQVSGGTEFPDQDRCYLARKNTTLIWPSDWTHPHKGVAAPNEEKYIITGWFTITDGLDEDMIARYG
jgi:hypothetical protein